MYFWHAPPFRVDLSNSGRGRARVEQIQPPLSNRRYKDLDLLRAHIRTSGEGPCPKQVLLSRLHLFLLQQLPLA